MGILNPIVVFRMAAQKNIRNKVVIVTGSGQGLGRAFARKLLEHGAKVCISDINKETGQETAKQLAAQYGEDKVHFIKCDVTKESELKKLYNGCETFFNGAVDIFCNNAGVSFDKGSRLCVEVNITAVLTACELAMDRMDTSKGGQGGLIVNVGSIAGFIPGISVGLASYHATKAGVVMMSRTLSHPSIFKDRRQGSMYLPLIYRHPSAL